MKRKDRDILKVLWDRVQHGAFEAMNPEHPFVQRMLNEGYLARDYTRADSYAKQYIVLTEAGKKEVGVVAN